MTSNRRMTYNTGGIICPRHALRFGEDGPYVLQDESASCNCGQEPSICEACGGRGRIQVGPAPTVNYGHTYAYPCPDCRCQ
jgi:hypothetical protein